MVYQLISLIGAILILAAYSAQHMRRLHADSRTYQLLNFFGAGLLCVVAVAARQYGFILLEGAWAVLSALALWRREEGEEGRIEN